MRALIYAELVAFKISNFEFNFFRLEFIRMMRDKTRKKTLRFNVSTFSTLTQYQILVFHSVYFCLF